MIDYLEQLFVPARWAEQGEEERSVPSSSLPQEPVQPLSVSAFREEEQWQQVAVRRVEGALSIPGTVRGRLEGEVGEELPRVRMDGEDPISGAYEPPFSGLPFRETQGEELEHRLRRNSRRYDSGFFLY